MVTESRLPVLAIVGRPNVGKSTLFNCLTRSRAALVANLPGVTRDRQYGEGSYEGERFIVIDTGGIETESDSEVFQLMERQSLEAIKEADVVLLVVDGKQGVLPDDNKIVDILRQNSKSVVLVVNKTEGIDEEIAKSDFYQLGFQDVVAVASAHHRGIHKLLQKVYSNIEFPPLPQTIEQESTLKIAFIGRPNVGKSTLVNRILGEDRVLVLDEPGTTRDSIFIPFERSGENYVLIDTAGVRRRGRIKEDVEKFSVIKSLQAIEACHVVIFVLNAREGVLDQDMRLLDFVVDSGKALVLAVNKWDHLSPQERSQVKNELERRLDFVSFARTRFISALYGSGVGDLFTSIHEAYANATRKVSTAKLTSILEDIISQHQPPLVRGRRIKLRYAHAGGFNPPIIVVHGNQTESLPIDYLRYLINSFRARLKLVGTPLRVELKKSDNPFKNRKNILTPRQKAKKTRLFRHHKKNKK